MNPFSKAAVVQLPDVCTIWCRGKMNALARPRRHLVYLKLVPLSPSLAGFDTRFTFRCNGHGQQAYRCTISGCRPRSGSAFRVPKPKHFVDVAFFGGKLYALSQVELFVVEIDPSYNVVDCYM
nr:unnamed protein product [Digitaria exilis]